MKSLKYKFQKTLIAAKKQNKEKLKNTDTTFSNVTVPQLTSSSQLIFSPQNGIYALCLSSQTFKWPLLANNKVGGWFPIHLEASNFGNKLVA